MALRKLKEKVLKMRKSGMSYGQIRAEVKVSKGTLSLWLRDMPLSADKINSLRANSQQRIERCRNTKAAKRHVRLNGIYKSISERIGSMSQREIFLCGLFLYWGEGSKTNCYTVEITNTDPTMIKFALSWFKSIGIDKGSLIARLKVYKDTNIEETVRFWSNLLGFNQSQFRFHIKKTNQSDITYKTGFGMGTCSLACSGRENGEYIMQSLKYLKNSFL